MSVEERFTVPAMEVNFDENLKLTSRKSNTKLFYIVKQSYLDITKISVRFIFF